MDEAFKKGMGNPTDPYYIAFARSIVELVDHVSSIDQIDLICDHDLETAKLCALHLEGIKLVEDEVKEKLARYLSKTTIRYQLCRLQIWWHIYPVAKRV